MNSSPRILLVALVATLAMIGAASGKSLVRFTGIDVCDFDRRCIHPAPKEDINVCFVLEHRSELGKGRLVTAPQLCLEYFVYCHAFAPKVCRQGPCKSDERIEDCKVEPEHQAIVQRNGTRNTFVKSAA